LVTRKELQQSIATVDRLVRHFILTIPSTEEYHPYSSCTTDSDQATSWSAVRSAFHELKGDIIVISHEPQTIDRVAGLIDSCRGTDAPPNLIMTWNEIRQLANKIADTLA
jgi:hypothetical protein